LSEYYLPKAVQTLVKNMAKGMVVRTA